MYDPSVGRWMQEDPIQFQAGDTNLYRYVGNDPTDLTDPSGLEPEKLSPPDILPNEDGFTVILKDNKANQAAVLTFKVTPKNMSFTAGLIGALAPGANLAGKDYTLDEAKKMLRVDHFNFFQVATITSDDKDKPIGKAIVNKDGKPLCQLNQPFIDPPFGGLHEKDGAAIKRLQWADDLPWYYDEKSPPAGVTADKMYSLTERVKQDGQKLSFSDYPTIQKRNVTIRFYTWLVGVDKAGAKVRWFPGIAWEWKSFKDGDTSSKFLYALKPLDEKTEKTEFTPLLQLPEAKKN